jgi:hypothetical protein
MANVANLRKESNLADLAEQDLERDPSGEWLIERRFP